MNVDKIANGAIEFVKQFFEDSKGDKAIIGISGGKNSALVAKICKEAIGGENVTGGIFDNGVQFNTTSAEKVVKELGINRTTIDMQKIMHSAFRSILDADYINHAGKHFAYNDFVITTQCRVNTPYRLKMTMLYAIGHCLSYNSRVANTNNLTEDFIGFNVKYGDTAGDFAPLAQLTSDEVIVLTNYFGLDTILEEDWIKDNDEDDWEFGFNYHDLNVYIRDYYKHERRSHLYDDEDLSEDLINKFIELNENKIYKINPIPTFIPKDKDLYGEYKDET